MFDLSKKSKKKMSRALNAAVTVTTSFSLLVSTMAQAYAQSIIVDPSAPGTSFLQTSNGTPQVNIANPISGVSLNQFKDLNVGSDGLILNNSTSSGLSIIGANVTANPNLVSGPANVIVNEVTSSARSSFTGTTEVFGQSAAVIVANPNGINCNGCSFLNSTSSTLTTGKPIVTGGTVGLLATQGAITIGPGGFNPGAQGGLVGRHVVVDGPISTTGQSNANGVLISGGAQRATIDFTNIDTSTIVAAPSTVAKTSPFAVDASSNNTITSGNVRIVNPEAGQGVNLYGATDAQSFEAQSAGNLFYSDITTSGYVDIIGDDIRQYGALNADGSVTISGNSFTLYDGRILNSVGDISLYATEFIVIAGEVSGDDIFIDVLDGSLSNSGFLLADGELSVVAGENITQERQIATEYDVRYDPALTQYLQAYYIQLLNGGAEADIAAELINRAGQQEVLKEYIDKGATSTGTNVTFTTISGDIRNTGGAVAATNNVLLTAGNKIINEYLALRSKLGAEDGCDNENCGYRTDFHAGELLAGYDLTLTAGTNTDFLAANAALITANDSNADFRAGNIENLGSDIAAGGNLNLTAASDVVNSLAQSNFTATYIISNLTTRSIGGKDGGYYVNNGSKNGTYVTTYTSGTVETRQNEENILSPGRISTLYGDVTINAGRNFISLGSEVSAGNDLSINTAGNAILTSFVGAEDDFIRTTTHGFGQVCTTTSGKDGGTNCNNRPIAGTGSGGENAIELRTATSNLIGRTVGITAEENIIVSGARILAADDLNLRSSTGSILIDSNDLPNNTTPSSNAELRLIDLSSNAAEQIFGVSGTQNEQSAADYIAFLKNNEHLTAVEALRRAESGADIKDAARIVGAQSYVSLIDNSRIDTLRSEVSASLTELYSITGADITAKDLEISNYHEGFQQELNQITNLLNLSGAQLGVKIQNDLDSVTTTYQTQLQNAETAYTNRLAANQAQYGHLLTTTSYYWRSLGKDNGRSLEARVTPNYTYINLKNQADAQASSDKTDAINLANTQRQLSEALVHASYTDESINAQLVELAETFDVNFARLSGERNTLINALAEGTSNVIGQLRTLEEQEIREDEIRRGFIAEGSVVEGEKTLASALTKQAFGELDLVQDVKTNADGIIENSRNAKIELTRLVEKLRDVGEWRETTKIIQNRVYTPATASTVCTGGKNGGCRTVCSGGSSGKNGGCSGGSYRYVDVTVPDTQWVITGTEEYLAKETYFDGPDDVERTRLVAKTRDVGEYQEKVTIVRVPHTTTYWGGKDSGYLRTRTTYTERRDVENVWVVTGTEDYQVEETYLDPVRTSVALISDDKAEQDAFIGATAWRFKGSDKLESSPLPTQNLLETEGALSLYSQENIGLSDAALIAKNKIGLSSFGNIGLEQSSLEGDSINVVAGGDLSASGITLNTVQDISVFAGNDINITSYQAGQTAATLEHSSIIAGRDLSLISQNDVTLNGLNADVGRDAQISAANDINLSVTQFINEVRTGDARNGTDLYEIDAQISEFAAGNDFKATAGNNATLEGAKIDAAGAIEIAALNDLILSAAQDIYNYERRTYSSSLFKKKTTFNSQTRVTNTGVDLNASGNIDLTAELGDLIAAGARFVSENGDINISAIQGDILAGTYTDIDQSRSESSSSSFFGLFGSTTNHSTDNRFATGTAALAGLDLTLVSGADTELVGAYLSAGNDLNINVGGDLRVLAAISSEREEFFQSKLGAVLATTETERSFKETALYTTFNAGGGLNFNVGGERILTLYNYADDAASDHVAQTVGDVYPEELLALANLILIEEQLADEYFYDKTATLSPAFVTALTIALTLGVGSAITATGASSLVTPAVAATATTPATAATLTAAGHATAGFAASAIVGSLNGAVSGDFDLGSILKDAAFSAATSFLASSINLKATGNLEGAEQAAKLSKDASKAVNILGDAPWSEALQKGLLRNGGKFNIAGIAEGVFDGALKAGATSAVYGTSFKDNFKNSAISTLVSLGLADAQSGIGDVFNERDANGNLVNGGEGSLGHIALHAVAGCAAAELQGASCGAGAAGAAAQAIYAGTLGGAGLSDEQQKNRAELIGTLVGFTFSGGQADNVSIAASIARSGIENNYLTHKQFDDLQNAYNTCGNDDCRQTIYDEYLGISAEQQHQLALCGNDLSCQAPHLQAMFAAQAHPLWQQFTAPSFRSHPLAALELQAHQVYLGFEYPGTTATPDASQAYAVYPEWSRENCQGQSGAQCISRFQGEVNRNALWQGITLGATAFTASATIGLAGGLSVAVAPQAVAAARQCAANPLCWAEASSLIGEVGLGLSGATSGQTFFTVASAGTVAAGNLILRHGDQIVGVVDDLGRVLQPVSQSVDDAGRFLLRNSDGVTGYLDDVGGFAPNRLQDLTPDQLSYQRLLDGVNELDVTTGRNQSVFYSGRGARDAAESHATANSLSTLEQTSGGRHLDDLQLYRGSVADVGQQQADQVWGRISTNYASQASGRVTAVINDPNPAGVFLTQELPTLLQNRSVTQINVRSLSGQQITIPRGTSLEDARQMIQGF